MPEPRYPSENPGIVIVQPWFNAIGHPAQSTLNTAKSLGVRKDVGYLISDPDGGEFEGIAVELGRYGSVERFRAPGASLRIGTMLALLALIRRRHRYAAAARVLFLDGYLPVLTVLWPLASLYLRSGRSLAVVCLGGPERLSAHPVARRLVSRFLSRQDVRIYLRTDELAQAWRAAFPQAPSGRIDTLPSLEIPDGELCLPPAADDGTCRFGVIGQVRPGKSIEWLVPLFAAHPRLGKLSVAGTFSIAEHRTRMPMLEGHAHFDNRFLTESEMLAAAAAQNYIIALYDDWDARMEAATVYVAARVGRPVIVYDRGWCGRIVRAYGCGIVAAQSPRPGEEFFRRLPMPGDPDYLRMQAGMLRFRDAHGGASSRELFLSKLRS